MKDKMIKNLCQFCITGDLKPKFSLKNGVSNILPQVTEKEGSTSLLLYHFIDGTYG